MRHLRAQSGDGRGRTVGSYTRRRRPRAAPLRKRKAQLGDVDYGLVAELLIDVVRGGISEVGEQEAEAPTRVDLCL